MKQYSSVRVGDYVYVFPRRTDHDDIPVLKKARVVYTETFGQWVTLGIIVDGHKSRINAFYKSTITTYESVDMVYSDEELALIAYNTYLKSLLQLALDEIKED